MGDLHVQADTVLSGVEGWQRTLPEPSVRIDQAADNLRIFVNGGEELISLLPQKPDRSPAEEECAIRILGYQRKARAEFLERHVDTLYDELTAGRTLSYRLPELLLEVLRRYPGLLPTPAQMERDRARVLVERDGREIDLGVFTRAVLLSSQSGPHLIDAMLRPTARAESLAQTFRERGYLELDTVLVERRGEAAHLTIRNLDCLNAEDLPLVVDLETAVDVALLDPGVRVGVLRGDVMTHPKYAGKRVFSAGINLRALKSGRIPLIEFLIVRELGVLNKLRRGLSLPHSSKVRGAVDQKPWVAAVESFAIGGGTQIVLVADRVIAADDAYFALPAAHEGLVPGAANLRLALATGGRFTRQLVLSGKRILATDPAAQFLADEVVPADRIDEAIERAVRELGTPAVRANRAMLNLAEEPPDAFRLYMAEFSLAQALRLHSADVSANAARIGRAP